MSDLAAMCRDIGFGGVKTYIASGNVVFSTDLSAAADKQRWRRGCLSMQANERRFSCAAPPKCSK
jgi:uncharacterized protein (DUF1697 family)